MTSQTAGSWELEGSGKLTDLLQSYDRVRDDWNFPKIGRFWDAVRIAHSLGRTGVGKTVAVIDGAVDLSIPRLAKQVTRVPVEKGEPSEPTAHCTAVALLISSVAPDITLHVYEVTRRGIPSIAAVRAAFELVKTSDAAIVNLSLSCRRALTPDEFAALESSGGVDEHGPTRPRWDDDCELCAAANAVADAGKIVVAAAGNAARTVSCPARSSRVVSCGFMIEHRAMMPDEGEASNVEVSPAFDHSRFVDVMIQQVEGALGTSFSAPLLSAFLSLDTDPDEFAAFLESCWYAATAEELRQMDAMFKGGRMLGASLNCFQRALLLNPHRHEREEVTEPCAECTLFSEDTYTNYGLALLKAGEWGRAECLFRAAAAFSPSSPHSFANLGWLKYQQALSKLREDLSVNAAVVVAILDSGCAYYDRAIELRPGFAPYANRRADIVDLRCRLTTDIDRRAKLGNILERIHENSMSVSDAFDLMNLIGLLDPEIVSAPIRGHVTSFLTSVARGRSPLAATLNERYDIEGLLHTWQR